jgi:hypothetical protein
MTPRRKPLPLSLSKHRPRSVASLLRILLARALLWASIWTGRAAVRLAGGRQTRAGQAAIVPSGTGSPRSRLWHSTLPRSDLPIGAFSFWEHAICAEEWVEGSRCARRCGPLDMTTGHYGAPLGRVPRPANSVRTHGDNRVFELRAAISVVSAEATMIFHARRSTFIAIGLLALSAGLARSQPNASPQSPPERHDPATSGAGPTSGAPGLHANDPPKGSSVTIDSSGVATFKPTQRPAPADAPLDRGNESADTIPPK